jgi:hypothetical protein
VKLGHLFGPVFPLHTSPGAELQEFLGRQSAPEPGIPPAEAARGDSLPQEITQP